MFYFAYGSNMDPDQMVARCPSALLLGPALLRDWDIAFRYPSTSFPGGGAADIVPSPGLEVWGILWRVSQEDLLSLDQYEDAPEGYYRQEVRILFQGQQPAVTTYMVKNKLPKDMLPTSEYRQIMLRGATRLPAIYRLRLSQRLKQSQS